MANNYIIHCHLAYVVEIWGHAELGVKDYLGTATVNPVELYLQLPKPVLPLKGLCYLSIGVFVKKLISKEIYHTVALLFRAINRTFKNQGALNIT